MMISVLILTHNEEANLPGCLASVAASDDVVVFDSFSSDRSVEIARAAGARVLQRPFDNYGAQREAALRTAGFRHPWLLILDADERPDDVLTAEMTALALGPPPPHTAYRVRRKDHFQGRWIRHASLYPSWFVRFLQHDRAHYPDRAVHEHPEIQGTMGSLAGHLLHDNFSKGIKAWRSKHERYAAMEAVETLKDLENRLDVAGLVRPDPLKRRRALKQLAARLPFRPMLRFLYSYVWRLGFLDGGPGLEYCRLMAWYERLIAENLRRLHAESAESLPRNDREGRP